MGRLDEARAILQQLKGISSVVAPRSTMFQNPEHRELFLSGVRLAAGEGT
jgi:lipopolysaccharide/colanic/teichoic acid biosynthesis glycosyltransferase